MRIIYLDHGNLLLVFGIVEILLRDYKELKIWLTEVKFFDYPLNIIPEPLSPLLFIALLPKFPLLNYTALYVVFAKVLFRLFIFFLVSPPSSPYDQELRKEFSERN